MQRYRSRAGGGWIAILALAACAGRPNVTHDESVTGQRVVLTAAAEGPPEPARASPSPGPPRVVIGSCVEGTTVERFTLAHLNDLQARYADRIAGRSRYAYLAGYLEALKEATPLTLVLDAGDDYEKGALAELRSMGEATRRLVQALPIDVRTIGNHDFAYGEDAVLRDLRESRHPVLASNVRRVGAGNEGETASPFASFVEVDIGCARIGVVGLVASSYGSNDYPSRAPFDDVFAQDDRYELVLADLVRRYRGQVHAFIALNHTGYGVDLDLARRVPGVDMVIGAHSEDLITQPTVMRRPDGSRVYVVQAGHWGLTLGRADVEVDLRERTLAVDRYGIVNVDATLPYDDDVAELARSVEEAAAPDAHASIAIVRAPIGQGKPMADLVFSAARERWGVDALLLGKDVFWDGLPAGPVTGQRLFDAVLVQKEPPGTSGFSSLYLVQVSGAALQALRSHLIVGPMYAYYAPEVTDAARTYRLAIEKRALENPAMAMYAGAPPLPEARYAGELIDLLEAYAKDRTRRGLTLP